MRWRTVFVIAGITGSAVICITHYRGPKPVVPDRIALFRRILTVTNLMCLAGNKPGEPKAGKRKRGMVQDIKAPARIRHGMGQTAQGYPSS